MPLQVTKVDQTRNVCEFAFTKCRKLYFHSLTQVQTNQENGTNGLRRMCHENGSIVADLLTEIRQCAAVIQVEMADENAVQIVVELSLRRHVFKIGKLPLKPNAQVTTQKIRST